MNNLQENPGTISQIGNMMRAENALVEEVSISSQNTGSILISYAVTTQNSLQIVEKLQLNIGRNTILTNANIRPIRLSDIQKGMRIDAAFSPVMTRSIPPQSSAFAIVVRQQMAVSESSVTMGQVAYVDIRNNSLYTGNPRDISSQIRYLITDTTIIQDHRGNRLRLYALRPGDRVRITHANFHTASIPPQTTAFRVERL